MADDFAFGLGNDPPFPVWLSEPIAQLAFVVVVGHVRVDGDFAY